MRSLLPLEAVHWACNQKKRGRPSRMEKDGLARSFLHIANQYPVNGKRSAKRLAFGAWGLVPKW